MTDIEHQPLNSTMGYSVREIATPTEDLFCWTDDGDQQRKVLHKARENGITYLPVKRQEHIVSLVRRDELSVGGEIPLTAEWLIAADTPIMHLIELFANQPDRVYLVLQSSRIIGLIAPADLNKVPARASIYLLMAQFEADLARLIRDELNESEDELEKYLTASRIRKLRAEHKNTQQGDMNLSLFHHLYLSDLCTIVSKHKDLRESLGFRSRKHVDRELNLTDLRNRVSHLTGLLLTSRDQLPDINSVCSRIIKISSMMNR